MKRTILAALAALSIVAIGHAGEVGNAVKPGVMAGATNVGVTQDSTVRLLGATEGAVGAAALKVYMINPLDRDTYLDKSIISDTTSIGSRGDSTLTPVYTAPYGRMFLHFRAYPVSGTALASTWVKFAVEVREGNSATIDTVGFVPFTPDSGNAKFFGSNTPPGKFTPSGNEFTTTVEQSGVAGNLGPNTEGAYLPLVTPSGVPYWGMYTYVKVRAIQQSAAAATGGGTWMLNVRLTGRPF